MKFSKFISLTICFFISFNIFSMDISEEFKNNIDRNNPEEVEIYSLLIRRIRISKLRDKFVNALKKVMIEMNDEEIIKMSNDNLLDELKSIQLDIQNIHDGLKEVVEIVKESNKKLDNLKINENEILQDMDENYFDEEVK